MLLYLICGRVTLHAPRTSTANPAMALLCTSATPFAVEVDLLLRNRTLLGEGEDDGVDTEPQLWFIAEVTRPGMDIPLVGVYGHQSAVEENSLEMVGRPCLRYAFTATLCRASTDLQF